MPRAQPIPSSTPTPSAALGWTLAVEPVNPGGEIGYDLSLARNGEGLLDLATVSGADCLGQDVEIALTTPLGTDLFQNAFGFDGLSVLTQPFDQATAQRMLELSVIKTLTFDRRIASVDDVSVTTNAASRVASIDARATTRTAGQIRVQLESADV